MIMSEAVVSRLECFLRIVCHRVALRLSNERIHKVFEGYETLVPFVIVSGNCFSRSACSVF